MTKDTETLLLLLLLIGVIYYFTNRAKLSGVNNEEVWEIHRNPDGSLRDITIHRQVRNV